MRSLGPVKLQYELPRAVENTRRGWVETLQGGAVASSVIAAIEAQLLVFYSDDTKFSHSGSTTQIAVKILTYTALICSISATMTSLILTDEFGEMPTRAARQRNENLEFGEYAGTDWNLLRLYHLRKGSKFIAYHWIVSLFIACLCTIASTAAYAGTQEALTTKIIVSIIAGLSAMPFCWYLVPAD